MSVNDNDSRKKALHATIEESYADGKSPSITASEYHKESLGIACDHPWESPFLFEADELRERERQAALILNKVSGMLTAQNFQFSHSQVAAIMVADMSKTKGHDASKS